MWSDIEDGVLVTFVEKTVMNNTVEAIDTETVENNNAEGVQDHGQSEDKANNIILGEITTQSRKAADTRYIEFRDSRQQRICACHRRYIRVIT